MLVVERTDRLKMNKARIVAQIARLQKEQCGLSYYIERLMKDLEIAKKEQRENEHLIEYYRGEIR